MIFQAEESWFASMVLAIIVKRFRPVTNMFLSFVTIFYFGIITYFRRTPRGCGGRVVIALDWFVKGDRFESREGSVFVMEPRRKICFALFLRRLGASANFQFLQAISHIWPVGVMKPIELRWYCRANVTIIELQPNSANPLQFLISSVTSSAGSAIPLQYNLSRRHVGVATLDRHE